MSKVKQEIFRDVIEFLVFSVLIPFEVELLFFSNVRTLLTSYHVISPFSLNPVLNWKFHIFLFLNLDLFTSVSGVSPPTSKKKIELSRYPIEFLVPSVLMLFDLIRSAFIMFIFKFEFHRLFSFLGYLNSSTMFYLTKTTFLNLCHVVSSVQSQSCSEMEILYLVLFSNFVFSETSQENIDLPRNPIEFLESSVLMLFDLTRNTSISFLFKFKFNRFFSVLPYLNSSTML